MGFPARTMTASFDVPIYIPANMNTQDEKNGRRGRLELLAFDPTTGTLTSKVRLTPEKLRTFTSAGQLGVIREAGSSLEQVLSNPSAIFEGLRAVIDEATGPTSSYEDKSGWRYYVGMPTHSYEADGTERPWRPQDIFVVEVTDGGVITRWWRERTDPIEKVLPVDHAGRFVTKLYGRAKQL
jgi:hypothetical protein